MPRSIFNTYGTVDVRAIEIARLRSAYIDARRDGDIALCAMILRSLHDWGADISG